MNTQLSWTFAYSYTTNTQQHIQNKLIDMAKERLSTTGLSVSEIAYELGFEHPQSFSKLFKQKTNQSPGEFRKLFNLVILPDNK
jgi:AraC-like DNA-binding protein